MASADPCVDVTDKRQFSYDELVQAHLAGAVEGIVELYNKSQRLTQVNVFSYLKPGDNFPFKINETLNIYSRLTVTEAHERFPTQLFDDPPIISRQAIIRTEKVEYGYCEVRSCDDQCPQVANVTQYLYLNNWVGVVRLSGCVKLYLMPSSTLTDHLGMTYPEHPRVLHGMFVRKLRRNKHSANISSGGDIDSAELEPRSKKRKIVSFAEDSTPSQDNSKEKVLLSVFTATPVLKLTKEKVKIQIKTPPDSHSVETPASITIETPKPMTHFVETPKPMTHSVETPEPGEVIEVCEGLIEEEEAPELLLLETAERPIKSRVSLAEYKRRRSTTDDRGGVNRKEDDTVTETDKEKTPSLQVHVPLTSERYNLTTDDRGVVTESDNNTETKKELIERSPTTDDGGMVTNRRNGTETNKEQDPPIKVTPTADDGGVVTMRETFTETDKGKTAPIETSLAHSTCTYHLTTDDRGAVNKRANDKAPPIEAIEVTAPLTRRSTADDGERVDKRDETENDNGPLNKVPLTSEVKQTIVIPDSRLITDTTVSISKIDSSASVSDSTVTVSDTTRASALSVSTPKTDSVFDSILTASDITNILLTASDISLLKTLSSLSEPGLKTPTYPTTTVSAASNTSLTISTQSSPILDTELPLMKPSTQSHSSQELITDVKFDDNKKPSSLDKSPVTTVSSNSVTPPLHTLTPATPAPPIVASLAEPPPPAAPIIPPQYFYHQNPWLMESRMIGTPHNFFRPPQMDVPRPPVAFPAAAPPSLGRYFPSDMFSTFNRYPVDDMLRLPRRSKRRSRSRSSSRSRSRSRSRSTSRSRSNHSDTNTVEASKQFMSKVISNLMKTHSENNEEKMDAATQTVVKTTSRRLQAGKGFKLMSVRSQTSNHTHSQSVQCKIDPKVMNRRVQTDGLPMSDNYTQTYIRMKDNSCQTKRSGNSRETVVEYNKTLEETIGVCDDSDVAEICRDSLTELMLELGFNSDDGSDYDTASMSVSSIDSDIERQPSPMFSGASNISEGELFDDSLVNELYSPSHPLDDLVSPGNSVTMMTAGVVLPTLDAETIQPPINNDNDTAPSRVLIPFLEHLHQPPIPQSVIPGLGTEPSQPARPSTDNGTAPSPVVMEHLHQPPILQLIPGLDAGPSQPSTDNDGSSRVLIPFLEHLHQPPIAHSTIPSLDAEPSQSSTDNDGSSRVLIPFLEHLHQPPIPRSVIPGLDASQPAHPSTDNDNDTFPSRVPIPFLEHLHQPPIPHSPFPAPPPLPPSYSPSEFEPEELPEKGSQSSCNSSSSSTSSSTSNNSTPRSSPEPPESGGMTQTGGGSHFRSSYGSKSPHNSKDKRSPRKQSPADHEPSKTECVDSVFIEAENKNDHKALQTTYAPLNHIEPKLKSETPRTVSPMPNFVWLCSPREKSVPTKLRGDSESPPKTSVNTSDKESSPLYDAAISIQLKSSAELNFENPPITTPKKPSLTAAQLLAKARAKRSSPEDRETKYPKKSSDTKPSSIFQRTNSEHRSAGSRSGIDMQQLMANFHQHMHKRSSRGSSFSRIHSYPPTHRPNPELGTSLSRSMPSIVQQVTPNQQQITPSRRIENSSGSSTQGQSLLSRDKQPKPCDQSYVFTPRNLASGFFGPALPMDMCDHSKNSDSSSPEESHGRNETSDFYGPALPMDSMYDRPKNYSSSPEVLRGSQDRAPFINTPVNSPIMPSPLHCPSLHSAVNSGCDRTLNIAFPAKTTIKNADSEDTVSIDERAGTCFEGTDSEGTVSVHSMEHTGDSNDNPLSKLNVSPENNGKDIHRTEEQPSVKVQDMEIATLEESSAVEDVLIVSAHGESIPNPSTDSVEAGRNKAVSEILSPMEELRELQKQPLEVTEMLTEIVQRHQIPPAMEINKVQCESYNSIPTEKGESTSFAQTNQQEMNVESTPAITEVPLYEFETSMKSLPVEIEKEQITKQANPVPVASVHWEPVLRHVVPSVALPEEESIREADMEKPITIVCGTGTVQLTIESPFKNTAEQKLPIEGDIDSTILITKKPSMSALHMGIIKCTLEERTAVEDCPRVSVQRDTYTSLAKTFIDNADSEDTMSIDDTCFEGTASEGTVSVQSMDDLAHTGDSNDNPLSKQNISDGEEQPSIKAQHMDIATLEERTAVEDFPRASVQRDTCTTSLAKTTTFVDITDSEDTISIDKRADTCFEGTYSKGTVSVQSMDDLAHTGDSNDNPLSKQNVSPEDDGEEQPSIKAQHMDIATLEEGIAVEDFPRASVQRDTCTTSLAKTTTFVDNTDSEDTISIDKRTDVCFEGTDSEGPVSVQSMDDLAHTGDSNDNPLSKQNVSPEDDGEEQPSIKAQHIEMATLEQSTAVEDVLIVSAHRESIPNPSTDSVEADRNKEVSEILSPLEEQLQEQSLEVPKSSSTILTEIVQKHQIQSAMATNKIQCDSLATEREECTSFTQTNQQEMNVESTPEIPLYEFETSMKSLPVEIEKEQIAKEANPVPVASVHWEPVLPHVAPSVALPKEESIREADMEKPISTVCSTGTVQLTIEPRFKNTAEQELAIECDIDSAILINALHIEIVKCTLEERTAVEDCPRVSVQRDTYTSLAKTFIDDADSEDTISIDERADVCFEGTDSEGTVSVQSMDDLAHTGDSNDNLLSKQNISDGEEQPSIKAQHIDIATLEERTAVEDFPRVSVQRDTYITSLAETTTFVDNADSEGRISIDERADTCFEGTDSEGTVSVQSMDDLARTGDSNDNPLSKQNIYPEDDGEEQLSIKAQHMEMAMLEQSTAVEDVLIVSAHGESIPNPSTDSVEAGRNKEVSEILSLLEDQLQEQSLEIPKESSFTEVLTEIVQKHQIPSAMETNKVQCESYNSLATERGESTSLAQTNQQDMNVESIYVPAIVEIPLHEFETSMKSLPVEIEKEQSAKEANSVPVASVHWEPVLPHLAPSVALPEEESTREADMEKPITIVCGTGTVQLTIESPFKNTAEQELPIEGDIDSEVLINAQHMEIVKCTLEERTAVEDCPRVSVQRDTYTSLAKTFIDNADSEDTISIDECADTCFEGTDSEGTVSVQSMDDLAYSNDNPLSKQNIYPEDDGKDIQQTEEQPSIKAQHMEIATLEQSTAVEDILIVSAHGESIPNPSIDSVEAGRNRAVSEILSPMEEIAKESSCTEMLTEIVQKHPVMETNKIQCESYNSLATERGECTSLAQTNQQEMNVESTPEIPLYEFETSIKSLPVEIEKEQIAKEANPVPVAPIQWEPVLPHLAPIVALPEEESIREADMEKPISTVCGTRTVQLTIEPPFKNTAEQELPIEGDIDSAILITKQPSMNAQHMKYTLEESTILKDFPIVSIQRDTHTTSLGTMTNYVDNAGSEDTNSIDKQLAICFEEDNSEGTVSVQSIDDLARTGDSNDNPLSEQIISPEDDGKDISVNAQHMEIATLEESTAVEDRTILSAHGESIPNPSTDSVEAGGNKEMSKIRSSIEEFRELQEQSLEDPKESLSTEMLTKIVQQNQIPSVQYESYDTLATKSISFAQTIESTPSVTEKKLREFETLMKSLPVEIEKEQSAKEANSVPVASVHWEPVLPHMAPSVALPEEESTRETDMEKPITTVCSTRTVQLTIEPRFKNTAEQELAIECDIDSAILINALHIEIVKCTLEERTAVEDCPRVSVQRDTYTSLAKTFIDDADSEDTISIDERADVCFEGTDSEGTVSVQSMDDLAHTGDSNDNLLSKQNISDGEEQPSIKAQHIDIATLEERTAVEDFPRVSVQRDTYITSLAETTTFVDNADSEGRISIDERADTCFEGTDSEGTVSVQSMDDLARTGDSNDNPLSKQNIYPEDDGEEQLSIKAQHMEMAMLEQSTAVEDVLIVSAHGESIPNPSTDSVEAGRNKEVSEILSLLEDQLQEQSLEIPKESSFTEVLTEIVQKHQIPSAMETNKVQCESYNSLATERGESTSLAQTNQQDMNVESIYVPAIVEIPLHEFETSMKSLPVEIEKEQSAKEANSVPVASVHWEPVLPHLAPSVALPEEESTREADMEKPITIVCGTGTVQLTIESPFKNTAEQELPIEGDIDSEVLINAQHMEIVKCTLEERTAVEDCPRVSVQRDTYTSLAKTFIDNADSEDTISIDECADTCFEGTDSEGTVSVQSMDDLAYSNDNPLSKQNIYPEDDGKDIQQTEEQPSIKAQHMEIATLEQSTAVEDILIVSAHGESIPNPSIDSVEAGRNRAVSEILSPMEEIAKESSCTEMLTEIVQKHPVMETNKIQCESYNSLATERGECTSLAQTNQQEMNVESTPEIPLYEFETSIKSLPVEIEKEQIAKEANPVPVAPIQWEPVLPHLAPIVALPEEESIREADMEKPISTVCGTRTVQLTIEPRFKNTAEQELPIEGDIDSAILITKQPSMNAQHMKYTLEESTILKDFPIVSIQRDTHTTSLGTMTNYVDNAGSEDTNSIDKQLAICFEEDNSEGTVSVQSIDDLARTGDSNDNPLSEQIISPEDDGKDISVNAQHMEIATLEESTAVEDRTILSAHGESIPNPSTDSVEAGGNKEMSKIRSSIEEFRELQEQSLEDPKESLSTEMLTKIVQQNQIPSVQYESYDTLATKSISFAQTIESTPSVTEKKLREFETLMKSLPVEIEKEQSAKEANSVPVASVHWEPVLPHMAPSVALPEEESTRETDMEKPITTVCSTGTVQLTIEPPFKNTAEQKLPIEGDIDSTFLIESNLVSPVQVQSISSPCEAPIKLSTTSSQVLSEQSKIETDSSVQMMCDAKTIKLSDTREQLVMEEAFASEPACIELECEQSSSKERILEAEIQHESTLLPTTSTDTAAADEKESKIEYLEGSTNEFSADPVVTEQLASSGETDHEVNKQLSEINTAVLNKNELIPASPIGSLTKEPEQPSEVYVNDYYISFSDKDFELCHHSNNDHITEVTVDLPNDTSWDTNILLTSEHVVSKKGRITRRSSGRQRKISTKYKDSWLFTKDKDNSITLPQQKRKTTTAHLGTKSPVSTSTVEDLLPLVTRSPLITQLKPETTHYQYDPTQCVDTDGMCTADTLTSMQGDYYSQPSPKSKRSKLTSLSDGIPIHNKPSHLTIDTPVQSKSSDVPKSKRSKPTSLSDGIPIHNKPPHLTIDTPVQSKSSDVPKSKRSKPTSLSDGIPIHNKPSHLTIDTPVQSKSSDVPKSKHSKPTSLSDGIPIHNKPSHLTIDTPVQSKSSDVPKSKRSKPTSLSDGIPIHNKPSHLTIDTPVQSKSSDVPKSKRSKPTSLSDGIPIHNKPPHLTIDTPVQSKSSDVPTPLLSTHHKQCSQTRPLLTHTAPTSPPSFRATIAQQKPKLNKTTVKQTVPFSAKMSLSHFRHLRSISPKLPPSTEPTCEITHRQCDPRIKSQRSDSCTTEQSKRIDGPASIPVQVKCCSNEKLSKPTTQYTSQFKSNNMPQPVPTSPLSVHNSYLTGTIVKNAESNQLCLIITRKKPSVQPAAVKKKVISNSSELQTINVPDSDSTISTKQSVSVDSLPMQQGNSKVECEIEKSSSEIVATVSANENDGNVEYVSIVNHDSTDKMSITSQMSVTESNFEKTESSTVINHKVQVDTSTKVKSSTQELSNVEVHVPMNTAYADFKDTPSAVMHEQTSNAKIINERANTRSELFAPARPLLVSRPRYHPYYRHHPSSSYGSTYPA